MRPRFSIVGVLLASIIAVAPPTATQAQVSNHYVNSIGMRFVRLPAGEVRIAEFVPPIAGRRGQGAGRGANDVGAGAQTATGAGAGARGGVAPAGGDPSGGRGAGRGAAQGQVPGPRGDNPAFAGRPYLEGGAVPTAEELAAEERGAAAARQAGFVVTISKPFFIGAHEVTQGQWTRVMGSNPSLFKGRPDSDNRPVDSVSWEQAYEFVRRLNALENTDSYRLPTEFEWEYAARAGGPSNTFDPPFFEQAVGGYNRNWETKPVGSLKPNRWGLYDMAGNVWEWVHDVYNNKLLADPTPPTEGTIHVIKGGSFLATGMNSIPWTHAAGPASVFDVGFRVVRDAGTER